MKLVFASNNVHKLQEIREILGESVEVVSMKEIGCTDDIPETSDTLQGNALQKAKYIHDKYHVDCFADDTGLEVEYLNGAPGVYTARYAGEHCKPEDNIVKLLKELEGTENRKAKFSTCICLILNNNIHYFEGVVQGYITKEKKGKEGFGYDPVFVPLETGITFAEMGEAEKNKISHRARAIFKMRDFLIKH